MSAVRVARMYEFDSISVSSYEASSLAAKLTERSGDGWDVVAIVPAGSEITAYLRRAGSESSESATAGDTAGAASAVSSTSSWDTAGAGAAAASTPSEPAGWGTAPESTPTTTTSAAGGWGASTAPATAPATPTTPSVPAGWYNDPAGRYELRYWDGSAWTEHVSRAGQQFMDPPVA
jgi:Protein of unknown function (DUF2510)